MNAAEKPPRIEENLDPADWSEFERLARRVLFDTVEYVKTVREAPVWRPVPTEIKDRLAEPLSSHSTKLEEVYELFRELILPYATGNTHPRFLGWVHGAGQASGLLAEMLAAAMNCNCGGREHAAIYVEQAVLSWCKDIFGFPKNSSGLLVSGTSMAQLIALTVARDRQAGWDVRKDGVNCGPTLQIYTSCEAHESVLRAAQVSGIGTRGVTLVDVDSEYRIDCGALRRQIQEDRIQGRRPVCVVGNAGTVNTGAIDDLAALAAICQEHGLWFHVDGAFAALIALSSELRGRLAGIEQADSLAFDFHKWLSVPYSAGCVLIRDAAAHQKSFRITPPYLSSTARGLASAPLWFCDYGPELSRGFIALKVWFALKEHGTEKLGRVIAQNVEQSEYLRELVRREPNLCLTAGDLNITCFRYEMAEVSAEESDNLNQEIVADLQEQGIAAPSTTRLHGRLMIRVNITNHRTRREDLDLLVKTIVHLGNTRAANLTRRATLENDGSTGSEILIVSSARSLTPGHTFQTS
jgi:glutamate/tyrosine decarboxylase-like PLP-dependent enzyme